MNSTVYLVFETNNRDEGFEIKYWSNNLTDCQTFLGDFYYELLNESNFTMLGYIPNELLEYTRRNIIYREAIKIAELSDASELTIDYIDPISFVS